MGNTESSQKWSWWMKNTFHIETLFIVGLLGTMIYFMWKYKSPKKGIEKLDKLVGDMLNLPTGMIKKKKKKVYKHQERCREIFQEIFKVPFKSVRPKWLCNPYEKSHRPLELDGYNEYIRTPSGRGVAFEYDGAQHSIYIKKFHPNGPEDLRYQMKKDGYKDHVCKKRGIVLIRIPHFVHYNDLERYIKLKLKKVGLSDSYPINITGKIKPDVISSIRI